jgi:hypothetical protein
VNSWEKKSYHIIISILSIDYQDYQDYQDNQDNQEYQDYQGIISTKLRPVAFKKPLPTNQAFTGRKWYSEVFIHI